MATTSSIWAVTTKGPPQMNEPIGAAYYCLVDGYVKGAQVTCHLLRRHNGPHEAVLKDELVKWPTGLSNSESTHFVSATPPSGQST
jgi:hypothetical protein